MKPDPMSQESQGSVTPHGGALKQLLVDADTAGELKREAVYLPS